MILVPLASAATWTAGVDAPTITETLALAADGDTVIIDGEWSECVDASGRTITLSGSGTLDGSGCDAALTTSGGDVTVEGLTFTNPDGRGIYGELGGLSLSEVTFTGTGRSDWSGGGVYGYGLTLTTTDCVFTGNVAYEGRSEEQHV